MKMNNSYRYIVVDDDSTNNMICKFVIKRFDSEAEITIFDNPEEALVYIQENYTECTDCRPTLLFLDINMPTMTGWEVLNTFKEFVSSVQNQFIVYILSSSIEDFSKKKECYPCVKGFISKPLKVEKLEAIFKENTAAPASLEYQGFEKDA